MKIIFPKHPGNKRKTDHDRLRILGQRVFNTFLPISLMVLIKTVNNPLFQGYFVTGRLATLVVICSAGDI